MKKRIYFFKIKSLLIIILTIIIITCSFNSQNAFAVGVLENYVNQATSTQMSDEALKDLLGQTGYKVASQSEIDNIRSKAKLETPELFNKYPLFFGVSQDSFPVSNDDRLKIETDLNGHSTVIGEIGADLREWINKTIDSLSDKPISIPYGNDIVGYNPGQFVRDTPQKIVEVGRWPFPLPNDSDIVVYRGTTLSGSTSASSSYISYSVVVKDNVDVFLRKYVNSTTFYEESCGRFQNGESYTIKTWAKKTVNTKSNYIPYPTTKSEVTENTKIPTEIAIPVKVGTDGLVTPTITPSTFPTTQIPSPTTNTDVGVGSSTITYKDPTVDPSTGKVIDSVVTPTPDPTSDPTTGPTNPTVPKGDIPELDFTPLQVATRKFPFCIPWDLWDTYKIFESSSEPFKYEFKQVDVNFGFMGAGSITVLPHFYLNFSDYPQIDTAVKVFKFIELILFIVFLILKTRNLIRG